MSINHYLNKSKKRSRSPEIEDYELPEFNKHDQKKDIQEFVENNKVGTIFVIVSNSQRKKDEYVKIVKGNNGYNTYEKAGLPIRSPIRSPSPKRGGKKTRKNKKKP